jgi:hypothetical protein
MDNNNENKFTIKDVATMLSRMELSTRDPVWNAHDPNTMSSLKLSFRVTSKDKNKHKGPKIRPLKEAWHIELKNYKEHVIVINNSVDDKVYYNYPATEEQIESMEIKLRYVLKEGEENWSCSGELWIPLNTVFYMYKNKYPICQ